MNTDHLISDIVFPQML